MVKWYLNRFKTLSRKEIIFRIGQMYRSKRERNDLNKHHFPAFFETKNERLLHIDSPLDLHFDPTVNIFGIKFHPAKIKDWNIDVSSNKRFPQQYSRLINMRNGHYGSAKHVWELNRMLFLPQLALEYRKYKRSETLNLIVNLLTSWIEQNPYLVGINWYSNIEVNIRLINWVLTWDILSIDELVETDHKLKEFVSKKWVPCIYSHCIFSFENPSLHSSANNHLISEYAGLFIANCKWSFPESDKWLYYAQTGLEKEILLQHSENGVNKEETAKYIQFITDFLLLCLVFGKKCGNILSSSFTIRFYKILKYIHDLLDIGGGIPNYGDEDNGRVFILDAREDLNLYYSILKSGVILFNDPSILPVRRTLDQKNRLLFGKRGESIFNSFPDRVIPSTSKAYLNEGHFIFRHQCNKEEVYFHFDAAALGYLSIAAHGHSDALSFVLHLNGQPYLTDPGTYCYHTHSDWRKYFLSTKAHNTISINDENQATYIGPTLWLNHYKTKVIDFSLSDKYDFVVAEHNGYQKHEVIHRRKAEFYKDSSQFVITDEVENRGGKTIKIEMPFHIHPRVDQELCENKLTLKSCGNKTVTLHLDAKLSWNVYKGETQPILGWFSNSFYSKEPSPVCLGKIKTSKTLKFVTTITIN